MSTDGAASANGSTSQEGAAAGGGSTANDDVIDAEFKEAK